VLVRPSYVLGGRAMEIVYTPGELAATSTPPFASPGDHPSCSTFLRGAIEIDVDALVRRDDVIIGGVMEHIEEAGVHSGDSACALPPTAALARALGVVGLINVQFAALRGEIYVLEVNPRAARTVPFVAKATGLPLARLAARVIAGAPLASLDLPPQRPPGMHSVKEAVLPFRRFRGVDPILGPEMKSTGEVMGAGPSFAEAYAKAQLSAGVVLPLGGRALLWVDDDDAPALIAVADHLRLLGFELCAAAPAALALRALGYPLDPHEDPTALAGISLVLAAGRAAQPLREAAGAARIPCYTTIAGLRAGARAIQRLLEGPLEPLTLAQIHAPADLLG
jgi:carbamoyl-phosphate synthase large subunit